MNRIAVVRSVFLPISETFIYGEIGQLKRYEPYVFCRIQKNKNLFPHRNVIIDPKHRRLEQMVQNRFFKLIHARFGTSGIRMMQMKEKWRIPLVTSFHGCDSPSTARMKKRKKSLQRLFAIGDCFTVPCQTMKDDLVRHGCPENKVIVHYSGIDVDKFAYKARSFPATGPVRIVYVGRLVEKKGTKLLLKAFHRVRQVYPQIKLSLIGDGVLKSKLKRLCKALHLEKHVEFMGALPHDEVAKQLEKAHIFCLPSMKDRTGNQEGIPNALKEAMACGLPVISTFHSGIPELIEDGVTGHLVAENDEVALARKLVEVINHPLTWHRIGMNARMKIESDFNRQVQTGKLEKLFDQVIKAHEIAERTPPLFSVIIPTYNRQRFIGRAIKSVLNQTCNDYEIIVVDDGSTDKTPDIVKSFGAKVRYVVQKNRGPSEARNTGIRFARGKFIAFLDSDDRFLPNKLQKNKQYLEDHPNCDFLYSWYYDKRPGRKKIVRKAKVFSNLNKFRFHLYKRTFMIRTSTVIVRRSCFDRTGLFTSGYRYSQDWDMWLRLACYYRGYCQNKPLVIYRRHDRKPLPSRYRHHRIRRNAFNLYRWNMSTLLTLNKKYLRGRSASKLRKSI